MIIATFWYRLEQESGLYFNMKYFEDLVSNGNLDEAENYLLGFINVDDNQISCKTIFEIRKLKYMEALDRQVLRAFFCNMYGGYTYVSSNFLHYIDRSESFFCVT